MKMKMSNNMKKLGLMFACIGAAITFPSLVQQVVAADIYNGAKDYPTTYNAPATKADFEGLSVFVLGGYAISKDDVDVNYEGHDIANFNGVAGEGELVGAELGYSFKLGERLVVKPLAGYQFTNVRSKLDIGDGDFTADIESGEGWYVGGELGVLVTDTSLLYIKAIYSETDTGDIEFDGGSVNIGDRQSWGFGGGTEIAITDKVFFKGEALYNIYDDKTAFEEDGLKVNLERGELVGKAGFGYRF